jgi:hypothetical protein
MTIAGNPKKLAQDVAQGFLFFTPATLRQYTGEDLRVLFSNLDIVLREIRGKQVPLENIEGLKERNVKARRLSQALFVVKSYAASKGIKL